MTDRNFVPPFTFDGCELLDHGGPHGRLGLLATCEHPAIAEYLADLLNEQMGPDDAYIAAAQPVNPYRARGES